MPNRDLYTELGLPEDATPEAVKAAYRLRAKKAHPDAGGTADAFERLRLAYDTLSDPDRRARYDETGQTEQPSDNMFAKVAAMLGKQLVTALQQLGERADETDVIADVRRCISTDIGKLNAHMRRAERAIAEVSKHIERLAFKGKGPDVLRRVLEDQLSQMHRELASITDTLAVCDAALIHLENYGWAFDDPFASWPKDAVPLPKEIPTAA